MSIPFCVAGRVLDEITGSDLLFHAKQVQESELVSLRLCRLTLGRGVFWEDKELTTLVQALCSLNSRASDMLSSLHGSAEAILVCRTNESKCRIICKLTTPIDDPWYKREQWLKDAVEKSGAEITKLLVLIHV